MSAEHQEYCDKKVYPLVEKMVTQTLVARPDLPVPFMVKWLAEETKKTIPSPKLLLKEEIEALQAQIGGLEQKLARLNEAVWVLAIGPELDPEELGRQKGVKVLDSQRVVAKGWRLAFSFKGIPMVEPAFANTEIGADEDTLHGVAFQIARDQLHIVDAAEVGWQRKSAQLETYDGLELEGYLYTAKDSAKVAETRPSARYLATLLKALRGADLAEDYVEAVSKTPTYKVGAVTLKSREDLPPVDSLRKISCQELMDIADMDQASHVSCLGYVFRVPRAKLFVGSHRGHDVTSRVLRQWRGEPEKGNDKGLPPYPEMQSLAPEEREYVHQWLDHYIWAGGSGAVVGFLSEFALQKGVLAEPDDGEEGEEPGEEEEEHQGAGDGASEAVGSALDSEASPCPPRQLPRRGAPAPEAADEASEEPVTEPDAAVPPASAPATTAEEEAATEPDAAAEPLVELQAEPPASEPLAAPGDAGHAEDPDPSLGPAIVPDDEGSGEPYIEEDEGPSELSKELGEGTDPGRPAPGELGEEEEDDEEDLSAEASHVKFGNRNTVD